MLSCKTNFFLLMRKALNLSNKDNEIEIFQTNKSAKIEIIQTNKSRKIDFFQTNNLINCLFLMI